MTRFLALHADAKREIDEAADYYHAARKGLGQAFLDEVEAALSQIAAYPEMNPCIAGIVRRKIVRRFPFSIFYSLSEGEVRILAVANQKRRPFYWGGRD